MNINPLKFYCQKVLPLAFDDSLSYYESLCKIADKLNEVIQSSNGIQPALEEIQSQINDLKNQIDDIDTNYVMELIQSYLQQSIKTVSFGLTTDGYFIAYIPDGWNDISFNTIQEGELYGHLVLCY